MLASSKQFAGLRLILFCTGLAVQMYSYQFCKKISVAQQILRWVWPWSHTFLLMVVLDCHFPLSCRQGYMLCYIHYVDDGTQISCISCRQLKLHYKFMFKQDMLGHAVILISFTMDFLDFCSEPMFWKGSKSKSQFYCKDMVNPMQWHRQPIATIL